MCPRPPGATRFWAVGALTTVVYVVATTTMMEPSSYPPPVCADLTLDNCESVSVWLATAPPQSTQVIVHRDHPPLIRPVAQKRIRALEVGDVVIFQGAERVVVRVEPYR